MTLVGNTTLKCDQHVTESSTNSSLDIIQHHLPTIVWYCWQINQHVTVFSISHLF